MPEWSRAPGKLGKTLTLRAHVDALTGYGQLAGGLIREVAKRGQAVQCLPMVAPWEPVAWGKAAVLADEVRSRLVNTNEEGWEPVMASPQHAAEVYPSLHLTMWESNRIPQDVVAILNRKQALIVPSEWAMLAFDAAGVTRPMHLAPLPVSDCFFTRAPLPTGPFTFGLTCRRAHGGLRKGVREACDYFLEAFPKHRDVRLKIKLYPDCQSDDLPVDPRIEVTKAAFTEREMVDWFRGIHAYISTSQAEGFGLCQVQAMAMGRPVIGAKAHAQAEYLCEQSGFPVPYELVRAEVANPANGYYEGFVMPPSREGMIEGMRQAFKDPDEVDLRGRYAFTKARTRYTWEKFVDRVLVALRAEGMPV